MNFQSAIARPAKPSFGPTRLVAALQHILMMTGGWQPPHQTKSPLKSLIADCERGSLNECQLLKQARKSGASLIAVRDPVGTHGLLADIGYNADRFWLWHRNLELWVSGKDDCCWLIPTDPYGDDVYLQQGISAESSRDSVAASRVRSAHIQYRGGSGRR